MRNPLSRSGDSQPRASRCERVQDRLPALVDGELGALRRRRTEGHVRGCAECSASLARQRRVAESLDELERVAGQKATGIEPPADLLESLLDQARDPGLRARAAGPARGAISGARPELSIALAAVIIALAALAGWAGWRIGRALSSDD